MSVCVVLFTVIMADHESVIGTDDRNNALDPICGEAIDLDRSLLSLGAFE